MIYSVGVDIAYIGRIRLAIERSGEQFLVKFFRNSEIEYCRSKKHSYAHFAMIFSAKESVLKGYGVGWNYTDWRNIEIEVGNVGKPKVNLYGKMDVERQRRAIESMYLDISYSGEYAATCCLMTYRE